MNVASGAGFGAAGVVQGDVSLSGDALIDFTSGSIRSIASNSLLSLSGADAFVTIGAENTSALTRLQTVVGSLDLQDGATLSLATSLSVSGFVGITTESDGVSSLSVKGALKNTGTVSVASETTSTGATLTVSGATSGSGTIDVGTDATVNLNGGVTGNQLIDFTGSNGVAAIGRAPSAVLSVADFADTDTLDLRGETVKNLSYADNTLTLTLSTGQTQNFAFSGSFTSLVYQSDMHGGTDIFARTAS